MEIKKISSFIVQSYRISNIKIHFLQNFSFKNGVDLHHLGSKEVLKIYIASLELFSSVNKPNVELK